jgi:hypothetical protein
MYVVLDLEVKDIYTLNKNVNTNNIDSLILSNVGEPKKGVFYFNFVLNFQYVNETFKPQRTNYASLESYEVIDSTLIINYFENIDDNTKVTVVSLPNNKFGVIINKTNKNGKTKTFFSNNCELKQKLI